MKHGEKTLPFCQKCGAEAAEGIKFCMKCGSKIGAKKIPPSPTDIMLVTTPSIPGYTIKKLFGIVTGITARTRGWGGKFVAGFQSMVGGEVSAFTSEIEKAKMESIERMKSNAQRLGANAIIGIDIETSNVFQSIVLISATGTAVILQPS